MKLKQTVLAVMLASGAIGAYAAPSLQTCAPMEVSSNSGAGLSYNLACEAGNWKLNYAGSVPAGEDAVNAQYRLTINGPDGVSFVQNRTVRLPSPAKLGQMLMREAVLLDSGDLALRDCKELGCTQYRPMTASNSNLSKAAVTLTPEAKRLADEQSRLTKEVEQLRADLAAAKAQGDKDKAAAIAEERRKAADALGKAKAEFEAYTAKVEARVKADADAAATKLEAERRGALTLLNSEKDSAAKHAAGLEAEIKRLNEAVATANRDRDAARAAEAKVRGELDLAHRTVEQSMKLPMAQKAAYEFALADLVSQHNEQLATLKRAMPGTNFKGVIDELSVPHINVDLVGAKGLEVKEPKAVLLQKPAADAKADAKPAKAKAEESREVVNKDVLERATKHMERAEKSEKAEAPAKAQAVPEGKRPAHQYSRVKGQWYDMWTEPPTPVERPARR